jgi:hypothetical protein
MRFRIHKLVITAAAKPERCSERCQSRVQKTRSETVKEEKPWYLKKDEENRVGSVNTKNKRNSYV